MSLTFSASSQAVLVSAYGYALDTETNIVQRANDPNDKTEWLRWDLTLGLSIAEAKAKYEGQGWSVATESQVEKLFSDIFVPGGQDGSGVIWSEFNENYQVLGDIQFDSKYEYSDVENRTLNFQNLFGYAFTSSAGEGHDPASSISAQFGEDADQDGRYNRATVRTSYTDSVGGYRENPQQVWLDGDLFGGTIDSGEIFSGVALTRNSDAILADPNNPPPPVETKIKIESNVIESNGNGLSDGGALSANVSDLIDTNDLTDVVFSSTYTKCAWSYDCAEEIKANDAFFIPGDYYQSWDLDLLKDGSTLNFGHEDPDLSGEIELTFTYDDTYMTSFQEHMLTMFHGIDGVWTKMDAVVDTDLNTVTVITNSFSSFALSTETDDADQLILVNDISSSVSVPEPSILALPLFSTSLSDKVM